MNGLLALLLGLVGGPPKDVLVDLPPIFTEESHTLAAPNRVMAKFTNSPAKLAARIAGFPILREIPQIGYTVLLVPYGKVDSSIRWLIQAGIVQEAEPDHVYFPAYTPNDPLFPNQWNLFDQKIPQAWDVIKGDSSTIIGVLDTGVDYNHSELSANMWSNPGEIADGLDNDGDGLIDDILGWDFAYNDNNPMDDYGHGTSCAGINAAIQDNNFEISGVAPKCKIMNVKIGLSSGYSYDSMFAPGIIYAADKGAKVLSISFFSDDLTPALRAATDYAYSKGTIMCVAAGNFDDCIPLYPAAYDAAIAVAAHAEGDRKAYFSNFGTWVDVSAPGVDITTVTMGGGYTTGFAGTSAAAPNAAGIVALLRSKYPSENLEQIRRRLEYSARPMAQIEEGEVVNYGILDAWNALNFSQPGSQSIGTLNLLARPEIRAMEPMTLPAEGGKIVLAGRRFKPGMNPISVLLGTTQLAITKWTDSRIEAVVPPGATGGPVVVRTKVASDPVNLTIGLAGASKENVMTDISDDSLVLGGTLPITGAVPDTWYADGSPLHLTVNILDGKRDLKWLVRGLDKSTISQLTINMTRTVPSVSANAQIGISIYDFSTGSYPYGSWTSAITDKPLVGTATVSKSLTGDVSRFVSYEGDVYFKVFVYLVDKNAWVDVDRFWLAWK